jgi:rRNA biogenesis protein RRP5
MADPPALHTTPVIATTFAPVLQLSQGFSWSNLVEPNRDGLSDSEESSDEVNAEAAKPKKRKKRHQIEHDLTADMHKKAPESTADFERIILGSPNSSFLWIQYMSFQLQLSEIEKAREIGRRALQTINFREEQEKLNVWIALLNLENAYGTEQTLEAVFKEAASHNDSKTVHLKLATILDQATKLQVRMFVSWISRKYLTLCLQEAEELYNKIVKKFGSSSKVWTNFGEYYLNHGNLEEARKLLPRSLQSLEKRKREEFNAVYLTRLF